MRHLIHRGDQRSVRSDTFSDISCRVSGPGAHSTAAATAAAAVKRKATSLSGRFAFGSNVPHTMRLHRAPSRSRNQPHSVWEWRDKQFHHTSVCVVATHDASMSHTTAAYSACVVASHSVPASPRPRRQVPEHTYAGAFRYGAPPVIGDKAHTRRSQFDLPRTAAPCRCVI